MGESQHPDPGSGMGESQHPDPGSGMNNPRSYFLELRNQFFAFFGVKILKFFEDPGWRQYGSGIRDGKKSDQGSGTNIPDPQHCFILQIPCIKQLLSIFNFTDAAEPDESDGENDPDPDRENLEQPILLRRPRFLRVKHRLVNSLKEARNEANYHRLDPIEPDQHST